MVTARIVSCLFLFLMTGSCALVNSEVQSELKTINVNYNVPAIKQPSTMSCWAASTTMLVSWNENRSLTIESVVLRAGTKYQNIFNNDNGISPNDEAIFYNKLGLTVLEGLNPSISYWGKLLKQYGPLSVTVDAVPGKGFIHAIVITGVKGDGTSKGTTVYYNDPADGKIHSPTFEVFIALYEGSANWPLQINHW